MITFENWFANIASTADLIASKDALWRAWVDGDRTITSAYDYSELAQQVLSDLGLDALTKHFSSELRSINAVEAFAEFTRAFVVVDQALEKGPALQDPSELLRSSEWRSLAQAAGKIAALPSAAPYRRPPNGSINK